MPLLEPHRDSRLRVSGAPEECDWGGGINSLWDSCAPQKSLMCDGSWCRLPKVEQMRMADADLADSIRPVQLDSPEE